MIIKKLERDQKMASAKSPGFMGSSPNLLAKVMDNIATSAATGPSFFQQKRVGSPVSDRSEDDRHEDGFAAVSRKISTAISKSISRSRDQLSKIERAENQSTNRLKLGSRDELDDVMSEDSEYEYFDDNEAFSLLGNYHVSSGSQYDLGAMKGEMALSVDNFGTVADGIKSKRSQSAEMDAVIMDDAVVQEQVRIYERKKAERIAAGLQKQDSDPKNIANAGGDSKIARRQTQKQPVKKDDKNEIPAILYDPKVRKQLAKQKSYKPWFLRLQLVAIIAVMILEIILSGGFADTSVNPLFGPDPAILLSMGAKHVPCMIRTKDARDFTNCTMNYVGTKPYTGAVAKTANNFCNYWEFLQEACGMGGFVGGNAERPNQWWRFIVPMYLHSGVVHIVINSFGLVRSGFAMEEQMGFIRMGFLYFLSGIGGNLFSALIRQKNSKLAEKVYSILTM